MQVALEYMQVGVGRDKIRTIVPQPRDETLAVLYMTRPRLKSHWQCEPRMQSLVPTLDPPRHGAFGREHPETLDATRMVWSEGEAFYSFGTVLAVVSLFKQRMHWLEMY